MHTIVYERPFWDKEFFGVVLGMTIMSMVLWFFLWVDLHLPLNIFWYIGTSLFLYYFITLSSAWYFNIRYMKTFLHKYYIYSNIIRFASLAILFILGAIVFWYCIPNKNIRSFLALGYSITLILVYPYQTYYSLKSQQYIKKLYSPAPINKKIFINFEKIVSFELKNYKATWNLFGIVMLPYIAFLAVGGKILQLDLSFIAYSTALLYGGVYAHFRLNRALYVWFFIVRKVQKEKGHSIYSDVYGIFKQNPELKEKLLGPIPVKK